MHSIFVNKSKTKSMMSTFTYKEHKMYEAHTIKQPGWVEYVDIESFNKFKLALMHIANESKSLDDAKELAVKVLKEVIEG